MWTTATSGPSAAASRSASVVLPEPAGPSMQTSRVLPSRGGAAARMRAARSATVSGRLRVHVGTAPPLLVISPRAASSRRWASVSVTAKIRIRRSYWSHGRDQVRYAASCHGVERGWSRMASSSSVRRCSWCSRSCPARSASPRKRHSCAGSTSAGSGRGRRGQRVEVVAERVGRAAGVVEMLGLIRGSTWSPEKNSPVRSSAKHRWPGCAPACGRRAAASRGSRRARRPRAAGRGRPCARRGRILGGPDVGRGLVGVGAEARPGSRPRRRPRRPGRGARASRRRWRRRGAWRPRRPTPAAPARPGRGGRSAGG